MTASRVATVLGLWGLLALLWLLAVSGGGAPLWVNRAAALAVAATSLGALAGWARGAWADSASGRVLLALVALALIVRFTGLDFELEQRFYADEGYYTRHATEINRGNVLVPSFHYPHLLYYLDAFAVWIASLFSGAATRVAGMVLDAEGWGFVVRLINRALVAVMGALTVIPVFRIAERVAGGTAAALSASLILFSTLYNDGSHLGICDVPSAFFATVAMLFVARLLDRERLADYLLAGLFAGLAAGSKYPAGAVAIGIAAIWLRWRLREREGSLSLLWSGLTAMATFVATSPALVLMPEVAFGDTRRGILHGLQVHGGEGWLGVTPPSNALYYLGLAAESWGLVVLAAGLGGLLLFEREGRRRLAWLLPFPLVYLGLIFSISVAVPRTLYPALPMLAVAAGCGGAALVARARALPRSRARLVAPLVLAALLAWPVGKTVLQAIAFTRPGTRVQAAEWIRENLPRGAIVIKEAFTPDLAASEYAVRPAVDRFIGRTPDAVLQRPEIDLLALSSAAYARFFQEQRLVPEDLEEVRARYRRIFDGYPLRARFEPGPLRLGPGVELYGVERESVSYAPRFTFSVDYAFVSDKRMLDRSSRSVVFSSPGQWCQVKGFFEGGRTGLRVAGDAPGGGRVEVRALDNRGVFEGPLDEEISVLFELPEPGKYFFYLRLEPGSRIERVTVGRDDS